MAKCKKKKKLFLLTLVHIAAVLAINRTNIFMNLI